MVDICVCCGDIVPEGTHVCPHCLNGGVSCPNCGKKLEIMNTSTCIINGKLTLCTLYHCNNCHLDWERETNYIGEPIKFTRKFWG